MTRSGGECPSRGSRGLDLYRQDPLRPGSGGTISRRGSRWCSPRTTTTGIPPTCPEAIAPSVNYDEPESYDLDLFAEHLGTLRSGRTVPRFAYDFGSGARRISGSLGPTNLVVAEGVLALWDSRIREAADLRVLLEGDLDELLRRRIQRDGAERCYSPDEVKQRFETMVIPAQRRYLAGAAGVADLVFPMDWGDECVARAAEAVEGNTSALPSTPTQGTSP